MKPKSTADTAKSESANRNSIAPAQATVLGKAAGRSSHPLSPLAEAMMKLASNQASMLNISNAAQLGADDNALLDAARNVQAYSALSGTFSDATRSGVRTGSPESALKHHESDIASSRRSAAPSGAGKAVGSAKEIGLLIRGARRKMRMSQQAFADLAGVGRRFVSELEAGKPTLEFDKVLKACGAAGIDMLAFVRTPT